MISSQTQSVTRWAGISLGVGIVVTIPLLALAQEYVPLAAIPGLTNQGSLSGFLNAAFRLGIVVAGFLAIVLIAYNGLVYMTSGAVGSKSDALGWIQDIFWGLALILFSVIILRTINPDILNFRLGVEKLAPTGKTVTQDVVYNRPEYSEIVRSTVRTAEENFTAVLKKDGLDTSGGEMETFVFPTGNYVRGSAEDLSYQTAQQNKNIFIQTCTSSGGTVRAGSGQVQASKVSEAVWSGSRNSTLVETFFCSKKISGAPAD